MGYLWFSPVSSNLFLNMTGSLLSQGKLEGSTTHSESPLTLRPRLLARPRLIPLQHKRKLTLRPAQRNAGPRSRLRRGEPQVEETVARMVPLHLGGMITVEGRRRDRVDATTLIDYGTSGSDIGC